MWANQEIAGLAVCISLRLLNGFNIHRLIGELIHVRLRRLHLLKIVPESPNKI